jgi:hypothetical protein
MSRGAGARALGTVLACAVIAGCAVHNPTDLAQRRPVIPTGTTTPAGAEAFFKPKAATRIMARLGYGNARPNPHSDLPGPLRAFLAACRGSTTPCYNVFFFYRDRYIGAAFASPKTRILVPSQDGKLVRVRAARPEGGVLSIRYIWDGATVIGLTGAGTRPVIRTPSHGSAVS